MDNFQAIMIGRTTERTSSTTAGPTISRWSTIRHKKGMSVAEFIEQAEAIDYGIMEQHRRRVDQLVDDPETAEILKPYYRYLCKRPCFHDEYLSAFNKPNVTLVDCPAGFDRVTEQGPVVDGEQYEVDCIIYGTGFEPERTPLYRRMGQEMVGRDGMTLAGKWKDGAATLSAS